MTTVTLERLRTISVVLMLLLGIAAIIIGLMGEEESKQSKSWVAMASIGGAALFGASLSMIIEQLLGTEIGDIRKYLLANERFDSAPDHLTTVAGIWHVYYLTKTRKKATWKYVRYVFHLADHGRSLRGAFSVEGPDSNVHTYRIEAGIRGNNLIIIFRASKGQESDAVEIVPKITNVNLEAYLGLQMLETWDGDFGVSYSIYSRRPLFESEELSDERQLELDRKLQNIGESMRVVDLRSFRPAASVELKGEQAQG
jgi:hypothetical protein